MSEKKIMLGNEALARGAYEAGCKVSAAYPGTPSTEISEYICQYNEIYSEWSPNEKVALEVAIGASISGVRALASMKHVGLNVAMDPLFTVSYTGINGGLVIIVADDPGLYSSQNEQDTRAIARASKVPLLEPSDSYEAKEFVKYAFELSETYDTPVIIRSTTRLSHSQSLVELSKRIEICDKDYTRDFSKYVMIPSNAQKRHLLVEKRDEALIRDSVNFPINKVEFGEKQLGFITSGIPYLYVKEAFPEASVLKLGIVNPLPKSLIEEFASHIDNLYIIEELDPIIEEQVLSWGIKVIGKELLTVQGEYSSNLLKKVIGNEALNLLPKNQVPNRPPILCPGCPHRSVFSVLKKLKVHALGDIGCYTLGALAPLDIIDTCICMGSSISTLHGMEKAKGPEYIKNWIAAIGDSTFMHTGLNSLIDMVYNRGTGTVIILDNSTTGMTGHQDHAASGKTLNGEPTFAVDLTTLCKAIGVKHVCEINSFDIHRLEETIKKFVAFNDVSVIIAKSPCVLLKKSISNSYQINKALCIKCKACMKYGCPAITENTDGLITINDTICNGCGLCTSSCNINAITLTGRGDISGN